MSDSSEDLPELGSQSSRPTSIRAKPEPSPKPRAKAKAKTTASQAAVKAKRKTTKPKAKVPRKTAAIKAGVKAKTKTECGKIVAKDAEKHSPVQQHWAQRLKVLPMKIPKKRLVIHILLTARLLIPLFVAPRFRRTRANPKATSAAKMRTMKTETHRVDKSV